MIIRTIRDLGIYDSTPLRRFSTDHIGLITGDACGGVVQHGIHDLHIIHIPSITAQHGIRTKAVPDLDASTFVITKVDVRRTHGLVCRTQS